MESDSNQRSGGGMNRREFMTRAGAATLAVSAFGGLGGLLSACGGESTSSSGSSASASAAAVPELNALTWQGYIEPEWTDPFKQKYGTTVVPTYISTVDQQIAKVASGGALWDVQNLSTDNTVELIGMGALQPLDTNGITSWNDLFSFLKEGDTADGKVYGVPWTWDVNPFLYNTEILTEAPTSWDIMWDPILKGRLGVWSDLSTIYTVAGVLGLDDPWERLNNLSDADLKAISVKLNALAPNVRVVWDDPGNLTNLLASGEVAASVGWTVLYNQMKADHPEIAKLVFEHHGANAWQDSWSISTNMSHPEARQRAMDWANWVTSPEMMATIAIKTGYSPANPKAADHMTPEQVKAANINTADEMFTKVMFKADPGPENRARYQKVMDDFRAAVS